MQDQLEAGNFPGESLACALARRAEVVIEGHDHHPQRGRISG
jgi:hypothetical protein